MSIEVPEGWESVRFDEAVTLQRGFDLPVQRRETGDFPVIASNGIVGTHNEPRVEGPGVVTGRSGTIGKVLFFDGAYWPLNTTLYVKDFHGNDPAFVFRFLEHFRLSRFATGTGVPTLNRNVVHTEPIIFPPLPEQRRIAEILSSVDDAIQSTQAVIEQTCKVKRGVLKRLLTKGIGHTRFKQTEIGKIPERWEVIPLSHIAKVQTGLAKGKKDVSDPIELPYLRVANVQDGFVDLTEMKMITVSKSQIARYSLEVGDVLLTEGGDYDKLGRGDVWRGQISPCLHQNHVFAVRPDQKRLLPDFLAALTGSQYGKQYFLSCSKRTTNLASINSTQVKQFPAVVPPLAEQQAIIDRFDSLSKGVETHQRHLHHLQRLKSALMTDLLTGRVRVIGQVETFLEARYADNTEVMECLKDLFRRYGRWGLKDSSFESKFTSGRDADFFAYLWEMVLASHLKNLGLDLQSADEGPDFGFLYKGQKIWIEAVCPGPEGLSEDWLRISKAGEAPRAQSVPHEQMLLRWTAALKEKKEKLTGRPRRSGGWRPGYLEKEVVGGGEPYVVAVSSCRLGPTSLHLHNSISQLPFAVEAAFPVGPIELVIDRQTMKTVDQRYSNRRFIKNQNDADVPTDSFLNPDYSGVSALLGTPAGIDAACGGKPPIVLVHNPLADNPLPQGILGVDHEFIAEDKGDHYELREVRYDRR
ncbi:restriction endonuclease subunit S [Magnetospira sp. QH-2]|uniref:restriction endonuclease subunit S n=1 Tax=Magnetospira sp. (strain QH-2) TaxID=1288970 RepID=UPI0003E814E9|nr:restriction endonuclease subunit S [Magnetospira sp. QH-2]CCQ72767.1 protein of unknown function [Magnetospira sp. QH-2]